MKKKVQTDVDPQQSAIEGGFLRLIYIYFWDFWYKAHEFLNVAQDV